MRELSENQIVELCKQLERAESLQKQQVFCSHLLVIDSGGGIQLHAIIKENFELQEKMLMIQVEPLSLSLEKSVTELSSSTRSTLCCES
jgi:hypothetical protein